MKRTHLPLNALRVLDAAARHLSFTRAADELAVTPAAVGQQIRALEDVLGVVLFRRTAKGLELTEEASAGLQPLREGFLQFEAAVQAMHRYLDLLENLHPSPLFTAEPRPVAGDLALGLFLVHAELLGKRLGLTPFEGRPHLRAFYDRLLKDADFARISKETDEGFAAARAALKATASKPAANKL